MKPEDRAKSKREFEKQVIESVDDLKELLKEAGMPEVQVFEVPYLSEDELREFVKKESKRNLDNM